MNRERRAVLKGVATLTVGSGVVGASGEVGASRALGGGAVGALSGVQQLDTALPPGVTLFDLNGDGEYAARVEAASDEMRDDAHPRPIHITSGGRSTVDYAASIVEPSAGTTLGGLDRLGYDYFAGPDDGHDDSSVAPDQTFVVVENADGRHGMYLSYDATDGQSAEEWATFDVLARIRGDTAGTSRWFEYTATEEGYDGRTFDDAVARFGEDARLVRVGVGHGNAVEPTILDVYYDNLVVNGTTNRFPVSVENRVSQTASF